MKTFEIYQRMRDIQAMCKIALRHASKSTLDEVVGRASGRTVEDMFSYIEMYATECAAELSVELYNGKPISFE